jgi:electron transport complex protein RnfG
MSDAVRFPLVLLLITGICGGILGYLFNVTRGPIAAAEKAKTTKSLYEIFGDKADISEPVQVPAAEDGSVPAFTYYKVKTVENGTEKIWYATIGSSDKCYTSSVPIQIMVGADESLALRRIAVVKSSETPGLGEAIKDVEKSFYLTDLFRGKKQEDKGPDYDNRKWLKQFNGLAKEDLGLASKSMGKVDAIAGATITSQAVIYAVQQALARIEMAIAHEKAAGAVVE